MRLVFVEPCAGAAAVSLRALAGGYVRPPLAYTGSKRKLAGAILEILGVRERPARVILNDAGPLGDVWRVLADPVQGARVAPLIASWSGEEPRELRERLYGEMAGRERADGTAQAAAWLVVAEWSFRPGHPESGAIFPDYPNRGNTRIENIAGHVATAHRLISGATAMRRDARDVPIPADASAYVIYFDPPYQGTAAYADALPRDAVIDLALRWRSAGARVAVSEAEPLPIPGWHTLEITDRAEARGGGLVSLGRRQPEFLTLSHPPAVAWGEQTRMFSLAGGVR